MKEEAGKTGLSVKGGGVGVSTDATEAARNVEGICRGWQPPPSLVVVIYFGRRVSHTPSKLLPSFGDRSRCTEWAAWPFPPRLKQLRFLIHHLALHLPPPPLLWTFRVCVASYIDATDARANPLRIRMHMYGNAETRSATRCNTRCLPGDV